MKRKKKLTPVGIAARVLVCIVGALALFAVMAVMGMLPAEPFDSASVSFDGGTTYRELEGDDFDAYMDWYNTITDSSIYLDNVGIVGSPVVGQKIMTIDHDNSIYFQFNQNIHYTEFDGEKAVFVCGMASDGTPYFSGTKVVLEGDMLSMTEELVERLK